MTLNRTGVTPQPHRHEGPHIVTPAHVVTLKRLGVNHDVLLEADLYADLVQDPKLKTDELRSNFVNRVMTDLKRIGLDAHMFHATGKADHPITALILADLAKLGLNDALLNQHALHKEEHIQPEEHVHTIAHHIDKDTMDELHLLVSSLCFLSKCFCCALLFLFVVCFLHSAAFSSTPHTKRE